MPIVNFDYALEALKAGKCIVFPTETVYGLGADYFSKSALEEIYTLKNRPLENPLAALISNLKMAEKLSKNLPEPFFVLAKAFWPGPLTLIVEKSDIVPDSATAGLNSIGLRMPDHPLTLKLIESLSSPISGTSANLSGHSSPTTAEEVAEHFPELPILDGGLALHGVESTIISLISDRPKLLRLGAISKQAIEKQLDTKLV